MHPPSIPATAPAYIGRFAPSPTGPLHFGSLVAAVGSYLEARTHYGQWLLRIEDIDTPRIIPGAADAIFKTLERFGFEWDGPVVWQSRNSDAYADAFETLRRNGQVFPCACTRREIQDSTLTRDGAHRYPGTCRQGLPPGRTPRAWRIRAEGIICFHDAIQGDQTEDLMHEAGDYIVLRADGIYAYQLAVVVDDATAGITHIVRGADLLDSTGRQYHLQNGLGLPHPVYAHLPVATNAAGEKLSKQTHACPIDSQPPAQTLLTALHFLGQHPPSTLATAPLQDIWAWARNHWTLKRVPACRHIPVPGFI